MSTKMKVFVTKYAEFLKEMAALGMSMDLFGEIENMPPLDIVYGITTAFYRVDDKDFETTIRDLAYVQGVKIDEEKFKLAKPCVIAFIKFVMDL
jgi:hypothetical protein